MNVINWKRVLYIILVIVALVAIVTWFMCGRAFTLSFILKSIENSVLIITGVVWIFCNFMWKLKFFQRWLVLVPNLNGVWKGKLASDWIDPMTKEHLLPRDIELTIKQSLFKISCILKTTESTSRSITAGFHVDPDSQVWELVYTYLNNPVQNIQKRSPIHYGTAMLTVDESASTVLLEGNYWTGRGTSGSMKLRRDKVIK